MFPLTITAVDKILFQGEATSVTCPGVDGELTVLKSHMPFISPLAQGTVLVRASEGEKLFPISKGMLMVNAEETIILV